MPSQTVYSYALGNPRSIGSVYNFCNREDGGLGPAYFWNNYFSSFRNIPGPTPNYSKKSIALIDYSFPADLYMKKTIDLYLQYFPSLFPNIEIVNTGPTLEKTTQLLNLYYSKGYRNFILTSNSNIAVSLIDWFNEYIDAVGISPNAQDSALDVPKRIYTLSPFINEKLRIFYFAGIRDYDIIFYINNPTYLVSTSTGQELQTICDLTGKQLITYDISNAETITTDYVNNLMTQIINSIPSGKTANILVSMITLTDMFYNVFNTTTPVTGLKFYNFLSSPLFTNIDSINYFNGILYQQSNAQAQLTSSPLWIAGFNTLGVVEYSPCALNALTMLQTIETVGVIGIDDLGSYSDSLIFDKVKRKVSSFSLYIATFYKTSSTTGKFFITRLYYDDQSENDYDVIS